MSKVYFKKIKSLTEVDLINEVSLEMIERIVTTENIKLGKTVPLKVHFGEPGNDTFITPNYFDGVKKYLKDNNIESCYMDTNVLYKGKRSYTKDHLKTALDHGFNDLEVIIADGDEDKPYDEILVDLDYCQTCKIGHKYSNYDNFMVMAHFKGHGLAGFGGAIKQLAMGFAARGGKLQQHSNVVPVIDKNACIRCGACVKKCPVAAITLENKADINPSICVGCASCTLVCSVNAISNTWDGTFFHEKLAEYAYAASLNKTNIYFNFVFNITKDCDCNGTHMDLVAPDIGLLVSTDPVAIDAASLDLVQKTVGEKIFESGRKTLVHGEKIGLGSITYDLIELN